VGNDRNGGAHCQVSSVDRRNAVAVVLPAALVVFSARAAPGQVARTITTVKPTSLGVISPDLSMLVPNALSEAV
jgi:hypothetical protein